MIDQQQTDLRRMAAENATLRAENERIASAQRSSMSKRIYEAAVAHAISEYPPREGDFVSYKAWAVEAEQEWNDDSSDD